MSVTTDGTTSDDLTADVAPFGLDPALLRQAAPTLFAGTPLSAAAGGAHHAEHGDV